MNLRRLISTIITSAISLLASSQLVVAAEDVHEHQEVLRDYSEEVLRLARERVQAATSSGALGGRSVGNSSRRARSSYTISCIKEESEHSNKYGLLTAMAEVSMIHYFLL